MNAQLRIGHLSPDAPAVNVYVDDELLLEGVEFGTIGEFVDVDAGSYDVSIVPAAGGDAVIDRTLTIDADTSYTVLAVGELADIDTLVLTDEEPTIRESDARVRFVHTAVDAPAVDVWANDASLFEGIAFGEISSFATVDAGAYDLRVVPSDASDAVLELPGTGFDGAASYTIFAVGTLADDSLDAILVPDFVSTDARKTVTCRPG